MSDDMISRLLARQKTNQTDLDALKTSSGPPSRRR
jgi:hypothetical protein